MTSNSSAAGDLTIPQVHRQGSVVKVDTWGGKGVLREDGESSGFKNIVGTVTLLYPNEEDAVRAESILSAWRDVDALVHCEVWEDGRASLTNQKTGQRVVVEPAS